jgi:hypothetical protein
MKRQEVALIAGLALLMVVGMSFAQAQTASPSSTASGGAMLYANGNVKVNGQLAGASTSIFAGDKVEVGDSSAVSISRSGSSIVLSPNSSVKYDPANLDVLKGTVRVSTTQGMSVHAGNVSVAPQDKNTAAKFDVTTNAGNVTVASQEGALAVNDGGRDVMLSSGSKTTLGAAQASAEPSNVAAANFLEGQLAQHPFYGVDNAGAAGPPPVLPACADARECIRPNVSQIAPCCCPPIVKCTGPTPF